MRVLLRNGQNIGKIRQVAGNAQGMGHLVFFHLAEDFRHPRSKFGKIDVAVRIDIHGAIVRAALLACARRESKETRSMRADDPFAQNHKIALDTVKYCDCWQMAPLLKTETRKQGKTARVMSKN